MKNTTKTKTLFEPNLVLKEITLPKRDEWVLRFGHWCLLHLKRGVGYWQQPDEVQELSPGATLVLTGQAQGSVLASQLSEVVITYFCLDPDKLIGFLNVRELQALKQSASSENHSARMLPPEHPISERFGNLCSHSGDSTLLVRLQLLQLFFELFPYPGGEDPVDSAQEPDGRERLRRSLTKMPTSEFLGVSLSDLAPQMQCSPRHLSRLFRQELGTSFREKQTELRLAKARQLLASSDDKIIEVALASGYHSYSHFADLFKKHFDLSPAKWRRQYGNKITRRQNITSLPRL